MPYNKQYELVPIPFSRRLKEFRLRFIPVIVFAVVVVMVAYLWDMRVYNPTFTGKVYAQVTLITAPETGLIQGMRVQEFDRVQYGDTLAVVVSVDTAIVATQIAVLRATIDLLELTQEPLSDWTRNRLDLAGLRLDIVRETVDRTTTELDLAQTRTEVERIRTLRTRDMASEQQLERAELELAQLEAEMRARNDGLAAMSSRFESLEQDDRRLEMRRGDIIAAAVAVHEQEIAALEAALRPFVVRAPFDGVIARVFFFNNSNVPRGEAFIQLESEVPTHIIGFLRQPLTVRPEPGMLVQVRSRRAEKRITAARLDKIGAQALQFEESVQRPGLLETGLPVKISLVGLESMGLVPGEFVDIVMQR